MKGISSEYKVICANIIENASSFNKRILIINSLGMTSLLYFPTQKAMKNLF